MKDLTSHLEKFWTREMLDAKDSGKLAKKHHGTLPHGSLDDASPSQGEPC